MAQTRNPWFKLVWLPCVISVAIWQAIGNYTRLHCRNWWLKLVSGESNEWQRLFVLVLPFDMPLQIVLDNTFVSSNLKIDEYQLFYPRTVYFLTINLFNFFFTNEKYGINIIIKKLKQKIISMCINSHFWLYIETNQKSKYEQYNQQYGV